MSVCEQRAISPSLFTCRERKRDRERSNLVDYFNPERQPHRRRRRDIKERFVTGMWFCGVLSVQYYSIKLVMFFDLEKVNITSIILAVIVRTAHRLLVVL